MQMHHSSNLVDSAMNYSSMQITSSKAKPVMGVFNPLKGEAHLNSI